MMTDSSTGILGFRTRYADARRPLQTSCPRLLTRLRDGSKPVPAADDEQARGIASAETLKPGGAIAFDGRAPIDESSSSDLR
jgi:hypothetical protein